MKKMFFVVLFALVILGLISCANANQTKKSIASLPPDCSKFMPLWGTDEEEFEVDFNEDGEKDYSLSFFVDVLGDHFVYKVFKKLNKEVFLIEEIIPTKKALERIGLTTVQTPVKTFLWLLKEKYLGPSKEEGYEIFFTDTKNTRKETRFWAKDKYEKWEIISYEEACEIVSKTCDKE